MRLSSKDGKALIELTAIERDGDNLSCRAKVAGAMKMVIYVRPEEAWEVKEVLGKGVLRFLPRFLYLGWKARRARQAKEPT